MAVRESSVDSPVYGVDSDLTALQMLMRAETGLSLAAQMADQWQRLHNLHSCNTRPVEPPKGHVFAYQLGAECLLALQCGFVNLEPRWKTRRAGEVYNGKFFIGSGIEAWPTAGHDRDITFSNECPPGRARVVGLDENGEGPERQHQLLLTAAQLGHLIPMELVDIPPDERFDRSSAYRTFGKRKIAYCL